MRSTETLTQTCAHVCSRWLLHIFLILLFHHGDHLTAFRLQRSFGGSTRPPFGSPAGDPDLHDGSLCCFLQNESVLDPDSIQGNGGKRRRSLRGQTAEVKVSPREMSTNGAGLWRVGPDDVLILTETQCQTCSKFTSVQELSGNKPFLILHIYMQKFQ